MNTRSSSIYQPWTSWRIAGGVLLALPVSMILVSFFSSLFHLPPEKNSHAVDIGIILVIWFGVSLVRGSIKHRLGALFLSSFYFILFSAVAILGMLFPSSHSQLNLFVPILHPQGLHYLMFWLTGLCFFGVPAYLLFRKNSIGLIRHCI